MIRSLKDSWRAIDLDQQCMEELFPVEFRSRTRLRAFSMNPSIRAAFWFRVAAKGKLGGRLARLILLSSFACDVSAGATIVGGLYLPHPIGIVIGRGVVLGSGVSLYQGVTIGANRYGAYPRIGNGAVLYPGCVVAGGMDIGANSTIGANLFVSRDVRAGDVVRESTR